MRSGEPALLEDFEFGGRAVVGHLPDRGGEGRAALIEGEGLVGVAEVGGDLSVDERVFFARSGLEPGQRPNGELGNTECSCVG